MVDIVSREDRSRMMSGIRSKNTQPELLVRQALHKKGFRFRLHVTELPGKPDLVFRKYRAVIFVHGCFWHGHDCHLFKWPSSRTGFWKEKINRNRQKDMESTMLLRDQGWKVFVIWECAIKGRTKLNIEAVAARVSKLLCGRVRFREIQGNNLVMRGA